jgi:hypothetical protein
MTVLSVTFRHALEASGVSADRIPQTIEWLTHPPLSFQLSLDNAKNVAAFDPDGAAQMLRLLEGTPDLKATWATLTTAERKRARRGWEMAPRGRPPVIDPALVIYCARVICEASGRRQFKFSRPATGGTAGGPMWRALMDALPRSLSYLSSQFGEPVTGSFVIAGHSETIVDIVKISRSKRFKDVSLKFGLGPTADDVANPLTGGGPSIFRHALSLARGKA